MSTVAAESPVRACLAAALRDGRLPPEAAEWDAASLLAVADEEGVSAMLDARLREGGGWDALPPDLRDGLAEAARAAAAQWMMRERELATLASAFGKGGFEVLLLKGSALAKWLYPRPYLRMGGDIDLLFATRAEAERAVEALRPLGYQLLFVPGRTHYEMTCRRLVDGTVRSELDLHFRLVNAPAYAELLAFDELWSAASPSSGFGPALRTLAPAHALAHACLNRALDAQNAIPDRLKLLYDLRLFCERMSLDEWEACNAMAASKQLCGITLCSLLAARHELAADVPEPILARLQAHSTTEALNHHRVGDWRYMQLRHLQALPTWTARVLYLWERLLPTRAQLRELHGQGFWWVQAWRRMVHGLARLRR